MSKESPVNTFLWASRLSDDIRTILSSKLVVMSPETIAEKLMCNVAVGKGILNGAVEMTTSQFITLCKLAEIEPADVLNAVSKNNPLLPKE